MAYANEALWRETSPVAIDKCWSNYSIRTGAGLRQVAYAVHGPQDSIIEQPPSHVPLVTGPALLRLGPVSELWRAQIVLLVCAGLAYSANDCLKTAPSFDRW
jgi:hypothetical protein